MKKLLTILLSVIIAVGVFAMAGCGDDKAVTYSKATEEQKTNVSSRLAAIAEAEAADEETILGEKADGKLTISFTPMGSETAINAEVNYLLKNQNLDRFYVELASKFNGNDFVSANAYVDKEVTSDDYAAYVSANASGASGIISGFIGGDVSESSESGTVDLSNIKAKLLLSDIKEAADLNEIEGRASGFAPMFGINMDSIGNNRGQLEEYFELVKNYNVDFDMSNIVDIYDMENVEVYIGSDDSIKLTVKLDEVAEILPGSELSAEIFIKLGEGTDYTVNVNLTFGLTNNKVTMTATYSLTISPLTEAIVMPTNLADYPYINPAEFMDKTI